VFKYPVDPDTINDPVITALPVYGNAVPPPVPKPLAAADADINVGDIYDAVYAKDAVNVLTFIDDIVVPIQFRNCIVPAAFCPIAAPNDNDPDAKDADAAYEALSTVIELVCELSTRLAVEAFTTKLAVLAFNT